MRPVRSDTWKIKYTTELNDFLFDFYNQINNLSKAFKSVRVCSRTENQGLIWYVTKTERWYKGIDLQRQLNLNVKPFFIIFTAKRTNITILIIGWSVQRRKR